MSDNEIKPRVWIGDRIRDEVAQRDAIISDVSRGCFYILRPVVGHGTWTAEDPTKLTLIERRTDRTI